jgi:sterol desaturase/sphingolipid hydroxylase (fatty acid hydroxylase superfamily)
MTVTAWRQFAPLYLYTAVALGLALLTAGQQLSPTTILLLFAAGFFSWSFIEYGLHRFIFHYHARSRLGRKIVYYAHMSHHEDPKRPKRIFVNLLLSIPVAGLYWLIAWLLTASWAMASFLLIGMSSGYFFYEWLHFQCHHGKSQLRMLRYLRHYHLLHHYRTPQLRFGVTSPLLDYFFGTFRPVVPLGTKHAA